MRAIILGIGPTRKIWINPEHIISMERAGSSTEIVAVSKNGSLHVNETPEAIMDLIFRSEDN